MSMIYDRIVHNEIKMKGEPGEVDPLAALRKKAEDKQGGFLGMPVVPTKQQLAEQRLSEQEAHIRSTVEFVREKERRAVAWRHTTDPDAAVPMLEVRGYPLFLLRLLYILLRLARRRPFPTMIRVPLPHSRETLDQVVWAPLLAAVSLLFETVDDPDRVNGCLEAFRCGVRVAAAGGLPAARDGYVAQLAKFTQLAAPGGMRGKHVAAFHCLSTTAIDAGSHLGDAWCHVLRAISRLEALHQMAAGGPTDHLLFAPTLAASGGSRQGGPRMDRSPSGRRVSANNAGGAAEPGAAASARGLLPPPGVLEQLPAEAAERVFVQSVNLSSEAIVDFMRALCAVSLEELNTAAAPRIFSLTKLVEARQSFSFSGIPFPPPSLLVHALKEWHFGAERERATCPLSLCKQIHPRRLSSTWRQVAHHNISRIRLVWSRLWAVLTEHFVKVRDDTLAPSSRFRAQALGLKVYCFVSGSRPLL